MYAGLFAPSQLHADAEADTDDSDADTTSTTYVEVLPSPIDVITPFLPLR